MKKYALFLLIIVFLSTTYCLAQNKNPLDSYTSFLKQQNTTAKDYILNLFTIHDIVILCERPHGEFTQYELIRDIIADKRFIENVGNVFTEIGLSTLNPALNTFMHTKNLAADSVDKRILYFQRHCSMWPTWTNANYSYFLKNVYLLNNKLPGTKAISLYPSDLPFSWINADSLAMIGLKLMLQNRDSIIAAQIISQFNLIKQSNQQRKKALVIMNYRHAFNQEFIIPGGHSIKNVAWYIFEKYKTRVANVMLNTVAITNEGFGSIQKGIWEAAFNKTGKTNLGFTFRNSPFGIDSFDYWPFHSGFIYKDIFTGFAFYRPLENHRIVEGVTGFVDSANKDEILGRIDLISIVNGEFKQKMGTLRKMIEEGNFFINNPEEKRYYNIDSLTKQRNSWLK